MWLIIILASLLLLPILYVILFLPIPSIPSSTETSSEDYKHHRHDRDHDKFHDGDLLKCEEEDEISNLQGVEYEGDGEDSDEDKKVK